MNTVDENFHLLSAAEQRGLRPDISVNNFSPFEAKLCLDVTVRSTLTYNHQNPEILNYFCDIQVFIHHHRLIIT